MRSKGYLYRLTALAAVLAAGWGCTEEFPADGTESPAGLVLEIGVGGKPTTSVASRAENDDDLREAAVSTVDVFFLQGEEVKSYIPKVTVTDGKAILATGSGWKDTYEGGYEVYVLANKHDYDNPLTLDVKETDLSWVKDKSALMRLEDTDPDVAKAEGEEYGQGEAFGGKTFLMDGTATWNADAAQANETLEVELAHAAAKLKVNLTYTEGFLKEGWSIVGVRKKLVHYVQNVRAFAKAGGMDAGLMDREGEPGPDGFSRRNQTEGGNGVGRKDVLYAYTYPNDWSADVAERETYFLVNVPYVDENQATHQNYYKVPVRVSSNLDDLKLDRNTEYTIEVTVDRLGNDNIDEPEELLPTFSIAPWKPETIDVDGETPNYLVVSETFVEMHNVKDTTLTFFSSTPISVEVTDAYFIDENGNPDYNYTIEGEGWWDPDENILVKNLITTRWDKNKLEGSITITSEIPTNVTARYITLIVTNQDKPTHRTETITIVQYPLEYISGVPGVYATRSDFEKTGNTYDNYINRNKVPDNVKLEDDTFASKVYDNGIYYVTKNRNSDYLSHGTTTVNSNNRMYLVQITSTSGEHTVARPIISGTGEDIVTLNDGENNRLISPVFMLASQLGAVQPANWTTAQNHCKEYVEVAKYPDGVTKRFADWRLPTFAELQIIARYQNTATEVMNVVLSGATYWSAHESRYLKTSSPDALDPSVGNSRTSCYIRCIRDVTPEDLAEFRAHGIK